MKFWLRNGIYLLAMGILLPWLIVRSWKTGRYRQGLRQKLLGLSADNSPHAPRAQSSPCLDGSQDRIWLHGVSVGEVQLIEPLVRELRLQRPDCALFVSTTTDSGMALARQLFPDLETFFFPFDFSWSVRRTLRAVQPTAVVLVELELWPNLIDLVHQSGIPLLVVNARLSAKSYRNYVALHYITKDMFRKLTQVVAQSQLVAERFERCGCPHNRITVSGSIKFDNVHFDPHSFEISRRRELLGLAADDRVVIAGSTQSPEETHACEAFMRLRPQWPQLKLIIVPRHPDRFDTVHEMLRKFPVKLLRRSHLQARVQASEWDVLLVDTVGELRWWWGLAEIALVGGSFGKRGGQNMLEPVAYGVNVAFGPNTSNFKDIAEMLLDGDAATRLDDLSELADWLEDQLADPAAGRQRGCRGRQLIGAQQGATRRTIDIILQESMRLI